MARRRLNARASLPVGHLGALPARVFRERWCEWRCSGRLTVKADTDYGLTTTLDNVEVIC